MPCIGRKKITREKINGFTAALTVSRLHPQEVLYVGVFTSADYAFCPVKVADFLFKFGAQQISRLVIGCKVEVLDFLLHYPIGHRVDVETYHVATKTVRFQKRRASAHEGVGDPASSKVVGIIKRFTQRTF